MKKDKMKVRKRSSKMRTIFRNPNYFSSYFSAFNIFVTNLNKIYETIKETITYSVVPTRIRNDFVINNLKGIVVTCDVRDGDIFYDGGVTIEINRRYNCGVFQNYPCSYNVNLDSSENKRKVKFFNLSEFTDSGEDANFTIKYFENDISDRFFNTYFYKMNNEKAQIVKLINILNKLSSNGSGQITRTSTTFGYIYNIIVPFRDFIFATPSLPFKPVMIKSQKLHHVLTLDATDRVFSFIVTDEVNSEYRVSILRPIEIFHDVSSTIPSTRQWSGYISITIDMDWNITMKFVGDGWNPNNEWIYGRLWFASGDDKVESDADATLSGESIYDVYFTNPNDNSRGYTDTVVRTHLLKAFRNIRNIDERQKSVFAEIKQNSNTSMKLFKDSNKNEPHYIKEGDDEIYVLRYQGRIEGYYGGSRQTFPSMSIDISGDIKVKLPNNLKSGNGYKFLTANSAGYKPLNPFSARIEDAFFGYSHINKSYYKLYGQKSNMLYLNENDIEYEKDIQSGIWYVALKNKIQYTHTYSVINGDGNNTLINYILEIDEKWNMSLSLDVSFDKDDLTDAWLYARMILETDAHDNKFNSNIILGDTINRTIYKGDGIGIDRGRIYSFRPCGNGFNRTCDLIGRRSITQYNKTVKYKSKKKIYDAALPVTNLNDFIRIDKSIIPYGVADYASGTSASESTAGYPYVDHIVKIGIQEQKPYSTIPNPIYTDSDQKFEINLTWDYHRIFNQYDTTTTMMPDAVVNISNALKYDRNEDGSFKVTITRPILINYTATMYYYPRGRDKDIDMDWKIIITIEIDKYWNVKYTYKTPDDAWFVPDDTNKNIQGYMRMRINDANNSEVILKNPDSVNSVRLYNSNYVRDLDTYTFIGWAEEKGLTANVYYSHNNPIKIFTSLSSMFRFDANFAAYYFTYKNKNSVTPNGGKPSEGYINRSVDGGTLINAILENTITLCGITYT